MRIYASREEPHERAAAREIDTPSGYGLELPRTSRDFPPNEFLIVDAVSRGGNTIVHVGRNIDDGPRFEKIAHVALTPREARALALELLAGAAMGERDQEPRGALEAGAGRFSSAD